MEMGMYIYGVDISKKSSTTAWVKLDSQGNIIAKNSSITNLCENINEDLFKKLRIAIGIEAPMWAPIPNMRKVKGNIQFNMKARFNVEMEKSSQSKNAKGYEWYQGIASSASMKAIIIGNRVFSQVAVKATKDIHEWNVDRPLFIYEGYCAGRFKPKQYYDSSVFTKLKLLTEHEIDAFVIATAFLTELRYIDRPNFEFREHLSVVCSNQKLQFTQSLIGKQSLVTNDFEHSDIVCLWNIILNGNVTGPQACSVFGFSF